MSVLVVLSAMGVCSTTNCFTRGPRLLSDSMLVLWLLSELELRLCDCWALACVCCLCVVCVWWGFLSCVRTRSGRSGSQDEGLGFVEDCTLVISTG